MKSNFFERLWQVFRAAPVPIEGQQRGVSLNIASSDSTGLGRNYDLEITEPIVRNIQKARQLVEMLEYCPEVATAINEISDSVWSSDDGDDQGFAIADTLNDNETPVDPMVKGILDRLIHEVIGGIALEPVAERILAYGDCFASLGVDLKRMRVERILFLPTWEMFRVEDNKGNLLRFEQRKYLSDQAAYVFHPLICIHWRYRRKSLYGRSLFYESIGDWHNLKAATEDLSNASRAIGVNPNLHIMPDCVDEDYRKQYKLAYENKKKTGAITDFFLMNGADIRKLSQSNPDLQALADNILTWRTRIVMKSRVPPWLLALPSIGAREIAGQPALAYARFINRVRMSVTEGVKKICNLELALNNIPKEEWNYRIVYPRIYVNPFQEQIDPLYSESTDPSIEDLD